MIRLGYRAVAAPVGLGMAWAITAAGAASVPVAAGCAGLVVASSTWPGLVHSRFKGRMHPAAALVRGSAHLGYKVAAPEGRELTDLDRGPSYCIEWCVLAGLLVVLVASQIPPLAQWAWWWGAAITVGTLSHVLADLPTPSGVPLSAVYNWVVHRDAWRRHSLGWFESDSAGEHFLAVPILFLVTVIMAMAMVGWLSPVAGWLMGVR